MAKYIIKQSSSKVLQKYIDNGQCKDTNRRNADGGIIYELPHLTIDLPVWPLNEVDNLTDGAVKKIKDTELSAMSDKDVVKALIDRKKTLAGNNHLGIYTRGEGEKKKLQNALANADAKAIRMTELFNLVVSGDMSVDEMSKIKESEGL